MPRVLRRDAVTDAAAHAFGNAVRHARTSLDLTQKELGAIIGGGQANVRQIELEGVTPRSKYFFLLCDELGLDPLSFGFEGEGLGIIEEWVEEHGKN